jgi:hypothetical protein
MVRGECTALRDMRRLLVIGMALAKQLPQPVQLLGSQNLAVQGRGMHCPSS